MKTPDRTFALLGTAASAFILAGSVLGGTFNANFNDGLVPLGAQVFGSAAVEAAGGAADTGCLKITKAVNSLQGGFIIEDLDGGANVYGFRATFNARIGGGSSIPADGWSFSVGPDLPDGAFGEGGVGSGIRVNFDTYDNVDNDPHNNTGEAPRINIVVGGVAVASTPILPVSDLINNAFVPVEIKLSPDGSLDVIYNGKAHFTKYYIPGYQALPAVRYGFGARTGGLNANHFIDDLSIESYLAPKPGIVQNPQSQMVVEGSSATFSVVLNNADTATVQWLRNGQVIAGETALSYTLAGATVAADDGAKFSARVTAGADVVTSTEATLNVVLIDLPATPVVAYSFNDGAVPGDTTVIGAGFAADLVTPWMPYVSPTGGVGDSGVLLLTEAVNGQAGAFIMPDPHAGAAVFGVAARFDVRIGGGTDVPADGMSFNFAADLPDVVSGDAEEGFGSGLRVCFDIYDNADGNPNNGTGEAPAITLKWGTTVVGESKVALSDLLTGDGYADVIVRLTADGKLDVAWNGKVLLYRAPVPGFGSIANGRFGFYARTGGLNANQWIDNLKLYTYLTAPLRISKQPAPLMVLVGKSATFAVEVNNPQGATYQWFRNGSPIGGATDNAYTLPAAAVADEGAKFKVEVTLGGEVATSDEVALSVLDLTPPVNPNLSLDFNNGQPAGTEISGTGTVDSFGGVDDSGVLKLTTSENAQKGGFLSGSLEDGAQLLEFTLAADVLAGLGTVVPADGFSVCIANDLPVAAPGDAEAGAGSGIIVTFDIYDNFDADPTNGTGEAPAIEVSYKGALVASKMVPLALVNSGVFDQLLVRVKENGLVDLAFGTTVVFRDLQVPNYVPMSGAKVALYARTGGANASYWFDNVRLGARIPVAVSITEEPKDTLVLAGQPATFGVLVSITQGVTYQWMRNGTTMAGATGSTYTTPALTAADEGAGYSVVVTGPGNSVTSRAAIVGVMAKFNAGADPAVDLNFDDGAVPPDGFVFGNAFVQSAGGVGGSPFLQLTEALNDQSSSFVLNTPASPTPINDFTVTWMMLVGGGTETPADGFSFVLAEDVGDAAFGEDGVGSGLIVGFDTYDNGTTEVAPEITIRYKTVDIATRSFPISVMRTGTEFWQIGVRVNRGGTLDLYYGNTAVYRGLVLPGFTPFGTSRFGWGARTGGLNDNHWMDDVQIALNTQADVGPTLAVSQSGGNIVITWSGGGTLQSTSALPGGWADIAGATSGYTTPASGSAKYFRVRQ